MREAVEALLDDLVRLHVRRRVEHEAHVEVDEQQREELVEAAAVTLLGQYAPDVGRKVGRRGRVDERLELLGLDRPAHAGPQAARLAQLAAQHDRRRANRIEALRRDVLQLVQVAQHRLEALRVPRREGGEALHREQPAAAHVRHRVLALKAHRLPQLAGAHERLRSEQHAPNRVERLQRLLVGIRVEFGREVLVQALQFVHDHPWRRLAAAEAASH